MIGKIEIYNKTSGKTTKWCDSKADLYSVTRTVLGEKMEVKYDFRSQDYNAIYKLTNFATGRRDRIAKFYVDDTLMHTFDTINGSIIVQEFATYELGYYKVEISFFLDVDDIC